MSDSSGQQRSLRITRLGVFCGSHLGTRSEYREAAAELGRLLVEEGMGLVYGGGNVGLMGVIADSVLELGGEVIGVIPRSLEEREVAHHGVTELRVVDSMHDRKRIIYGLSDALVAMPGGIGTYDELFESLTWNQLGIHLKPAGLLNVGGYYDPMVKMLDRAVEHGFVGRQHRDLLVVEARPDQLLSRLLATELPVESQWVDPRLRAEGEI